MQVLQHKVVSLLPVLLQPNSVYYVRNGTGFDIKVTNNSGVVVSYELNANLNKVDKVTGKGLSESEYTQVEKTKLAGIEAGATKNRADSANADKVHTHTTAQVTGLDTTLAGKADKTTQVIAGTGLTGGGDLTANRTLSVTYGTAVGTAAQGNDSRINNGQTAFGWGSHASAGYVKTDTKYTAGNGLTLSGTAFSLPITVTGTGTYISDVVQTATGITVTKATPPNTDTTYAEIPSAEVTTGTASTLRTITGRRLKEAVVAHGLAIGDTATTAKAGNWAPSWNEVASKPAFIGAGTTEAEARAAIGAGTSNLALGTAAGTAAQGNDSRLSNSREWTATTITQAEAEAGTATTRRAFTAQRVRQAIVAWFNGISGALGRTILTRTTADQVRTDIGLGTAATYNVGEDTGQVMQVGAFGLGGNGATENESALEPCGFGGNGQVGFYIQHRYAANIPGFRISKSPYYADFWLESSTGSSTTYNSRVMILHTGNLLQTTGTRIDVAMSQNAVADAIANIPSVPKSSAYTARASDKGKSIDTTAGVTLPSSVFAVGDVIIVTNTSASNISITPAAGVTSRLAGTDSTGIRTLAGYGVATLRMVSSNVWFASGAGLS